MTKINLRLTANQKTQLKDAIQKVEAFAARITPYWSQMSERQKQLAREKSPALDRLLRVLEDFR